MHFRSIYLSSIFCVYLFLGSLTSMAGFNPIEYPALEKQYSDSLSFAYEAFYIQKSDTLGLVYTYGNRLLHFKRTQPGLSEALLFFLENEGVQKQLNLMEQYKVQIGIYTFYWAGSDDFVADAVEKIDEIIRVTDEKNWQDLMVEAFLLKHYLLEGRSVNYHFPEEISSFYQKNLNYTETISSKSARLNILMGRYALANNNLSTAEICFQKAEKINEKIGQWSNIALSKLFLSQTYRLKGNYSSTLERCNMVLKITKQSDSMNGLDLSRWAYEEKAKTHAAIGNFREANENWVNYDAAIKALNMKSSEINSVEYSFLEIFQIQSIAKKKEEELSKQLLSQSKQQNDTLRLFNLSLIAFGMITTLGIFLWFLQRKKRIKHENELLILAKQEEEREHISRELHDNVGNTLIAIKNSLKGSADYEKVRYLFEDVYQYIRTASHQLSSSVVSEIGLVKSCKEYISFIDNEKRIKSYFPPSEYDLENHKSKAVYRIVQELIQNALQHSHADQIRFALYFEEREIRIHVEDNGQGFQQNKSHLGTGISNIKHRLSLLDGEMEIDSNNDAGTSIWVNVPV